MKISEEDDIKVDTVLNQEENILICVAITFQNLLYCSYI